MSLLERSQQALRVLESYNSPAEPPPAETLRLAHWLEGVLGCPVVPKSADTFQADNLLFSVYCEKEFVDPDWPKVDVYYVSLHSASNSYSVWSGMNPLNGPADILAGIARVVDENPNVVFTAS